MNLLVALLPPNRTSLSKKSHLSFCAYAVSIFLLICGCGNEEVVTKTFTTSGEREPAVSPDGQYIAYTNEGEYEIWLFDLAVEESSYLTDGSLPNWSPDGEWLVFVKNRNIHKINVETNEIGQLTTWGSCFYPDWSPNDYFIAFDCTIGHVDSNGIWILDIVSANTTHLGLGREPDWSANCATIAYTGRSAYPSHHEHDVWVTDTSGTGTLQLTSHGGRSPAFCPDGSKIAYVGETLEESERIIRDIWTMDASGTNKIRLTTDGGLDPAWTPDSNQIVYAKGEVFETATEIEIIYHLWIMNSDGSNKRQLTGGVEGVSGYKCK